jgi:glycerophosphoryl diester phosphodiesterase
MNAGRVFVLGHRGAVLGNAPFHQNSLAAFAEALSAADGFETDACADRDGEVFLIHEARYADAATGVVYCAADHLDGAGAALAGSRRIEEMATDDMRRLRLKDGSPVPLLKDALGMTGALPGKIINIELKGCGAALPVLRVLDDAFRRKVIAPSCVFVSSSD